MLNHMRGVQDKVTDFNVGSVARTLVEAPAVEIDELYQQMFHGLKEAIPVAVFSTFGFDRLPAVPARGVVGVTVAKADKPVTIAAGTTFTPSSSGVVFSSLRDVTIPAGETSAAVYVAAKTAGAATNIPAGASFSLSPSPDGFASASNPYAFTNGEDVESDDRRKIRFNDFIASLNRGSPKAIKYALSLAKIADDNGLVVEKVEFSAVTEPGYVLCYIHNGVDGASPALLKRAEECVDGYYDSDGRPVPGYSGAGVKVLIYVAQNVLVDIAGALTISPWYAGKEAEIKAKAGAAIANYIAGRGIGEPVIVAEIYAMVMAIDGVDNFIPSRTDDVQIPARQKAMPGAINLTAG